MRAHGIDINHWNGTYTPAALPPRPVDFAVQKLTEAIYRDTGYTSLKEAIQPIPIRGGYHYLRGQWPWKDQMDVFLEQLTGDYHFWALDVEKQLNYSGLPILNKPYPGFIESVPLAMEYLVKHAGRPGLFYTGAGMMDWLKPVWKELSGYDLWIAHYWKKPNPEGIADYYTIRGADVMRRDWKFWQYDKNGQGGRGREYGVQSRGLDLNVFNGSGEDLHAWAKPITEPPAPIPVPVPTPVPPTGDTMAIPFVSQVGPGADQFHNDCGISASAMGIRSFNVGLTDSVDRMMTMVVPAAEAGKRGVYIHELQALFALYGIPTELLRNQSIASLFALLAANKIVIPLIHYQPLVDAGLTEFKNFGAAHFVVAVGTKVLAGGQKSVIIHDSYATSAATGAFREIPFAVWDKAWSTTYLDEGNTPYSCIATTIPIQNLDKPPVPQAGTKYSMIAGVAYGINVSKGPGPTSEYGRVKTLVKAETPFVYLSPTIIGNWGLLADGSGWVYRTYLKATV